MIVDGAWYRSGERAVESLDVGALAAHRGSGGFGWLGLQTPDDAELSAAAAAFDIPAIIATDVRRTHDRPKVEVHDHCLLVVVPTAHYVDHREVVEFGTLFFVVGPDFVVTVRYGEGAPLRGVRAELERRPEVLAHGSGAVLQAALLHVVESYAPVLDGIENDVREVERDVFSEHRSQPTRRIYFLIREVLDFLIALEPMQSAMKRLAGEACAPWVDRRMAPLFRDVQDELDGTLERTRTASSLLNNALQASLAQASMRQNEDTRRISAWAAIGVVPTVIAGLFGMNLDGIPGADHPAGFAAVSVLCLAVCVWLYRTFRRAGWL